MPRKLKRKRTFPRRLIFEQNVLSVPFLEVRQDPVADPLADVLGTEGAFDRVQHQLERLVFADADFVLQDAVFVREVDVRDAGVVRVHRQGQAALEQGLVFRPFQGRDAVRLDFARRGEFERNRLFLEVFHRVRVSDAAHAVSDAFGP